MPTEIEPQLLTFKGWTFRLARDQVKSGRLLILLHGWTGDEKSMWTLARNLRPSFTILAPRGPFPVPEGGYAWREVNAGSWGKATLEDFRPAVEALLTFVEDWTASAGIQASQFDLMGFSQGAAMTYAFALLHPERVRRLVALSGFIPENGEAWLVADKFSGKPVFVSHGRQDASIPVEQSRRAVALLKGAGAQVIYCESEGGHKVSQECLKAMERFLEEI